MGLVRDVQAMPIWVRTESGIFGLNWLLHSTNVLDPNEQKNFHSNAAPGAPLERSVYVAFGRWSVERCLDDEKSELGLSHFEVIGFQAVERHLLVTHISHLFRARETKRRRREKSGGHRMPNSHEGRLGRCFARSIFSFATAAL